MFAKIEAFPPFFQCRNKKCLKPPPRICRFCCSFSNMKPTIATNFPTPLGDVFRFRENVSPENEPKSTWDDDISFKHGPFLGDMFVFLHIHVYLWLQKLVFWTTKPWQTWHTRTAIYCCFGGGYIPNNKKATCWPIPIGSMYSIFSYIMICWSFYLVNYKVNIRTIFHGSSGIGIISLSPRLLRFGLENVSLRWLVQIWDPKNPSVSCLREWNA